LKNYETKDSNKYPIIFKIIIFSLSSKQLYKKA
jgi:hypothetical protein